MNRGGASTIREKATALPVIARPPMPGIWFEIADLFDHFRRDLNPTGLQRVGLEVIAAAHDHFGDRTGFCRVSPHSGCLEFVAYDRVGRIRRAPAFATARQSLLSHAIVPTYQIARHALRHVGFWLHDSFSGARWEHDWSRLIMPGDFLICVGLPWRDRGYAGSIAALKKRTGLRYALLIHDVLPFTDPELCQPGFVSRFRPWLEQLLPHCDLVFAASRHSRQEIEEMCAIHGWASPPINVIRFGAGFNACSEATGASHTAFPAIFVLYVSSMTRRKNHAFLLRVWRKLLKRHDRDHERDAVPHLVLIGGGPQFGSIAAAIRNDDLIRNRVTMLRNPSDSVVGEAYRRCRFTIFPSLREGWGLPVAESLAAGKLCLASNQTSLPEVGGDLADYFDPTDEADAVAKLERILFEPGYLSRREARIAAEYRPPSWSDCVGDIIHRVDTFPAAAAGPAP